MSSLSRTRRLRAAGAVLAASAAAGAVLVLVLSRGGVPERTSSAAHAPAHPSLPAAPPTTAPAVKALAPDTTSAVPRTTVPATTSLPPSTTTTLPPPTTTTTTTSTVPPTTTTSCGGALPAQLATTGGASQLVTVEADGYGTTWATLTAWSKEGSCWHVAYGPFSARLGWSGLEQPSKKVEGDGGTPEGIYGFGPVMYGNAANPGVAYPYHDLVCGDWWDEDPESAQYNLFVHWPCGSTPPFAQGPAGAGSEALWKETVPYPAFAVIAYNTARVAGRGSAIFLHYGLASATAGCVSIDMNPLDEVLDWLRPSGDPRIVIGTSGDITRY